MHICSFINQNAYYAHCFVTGIFYLIYLDIISVSAHGDNHIVSALNNASVTISARTVNVSAHTS